MGQCYIASKNADVLWHQSHTDTNLGLQSMGLTSCSLSLKRHQALGLTASRNIQHTVQCKYEITYKSILIMTVETGQLKSTVLSEAVPDLSRNQRGAIWLYYIENVDEIVTAQI